MADEKLLHAEDVIFNKPSLKEFVRLIKNGAVHEIWPSTQDEFNWWNGINTYAGQDPGYKQYIDETRELTEDKLRIKSLKTSITVRYGDDQDVKSIEDIDFDETEKKYKNITEKNINDTKNEIVNQRYYDNTSDIYPDENLQLSLNKTNGSINNSSNVINYATNIKELYLSYVNKLEDLIKRIEDFIPVKGEIIYTLKDENISSNYNDFFNDVKDDTIPQELIDRLETNIILEEQYLLDKEQHIYDIDTFLTEDGQYKIIEDNNYYFNNIMDKIAKYINKINNIKPLIIKYYPSFNFSKFTNCITEIKTIINKYVKVDEKEGIKEKLETRLNQYFSNINNDIKEELDRIKNMALLGIQADEYIESQKKPYEEDIDRNLFLEDFFDRHINFYSKLYYIQYNGEKTLEDARNEFLSLRARIQSTLKDCDNFDEMCLAFNNLFLAEINPVLSDIKSLDVNGYILLNLSLLTTIIYQADGTVKNLNIITERIEKSFNILKYLCELLNDQEYSEIGSANSSDTIADYQTTSNLLQSELNAIESLTIYNDQPMTELKKDQTKLSEFLNTMFKEFNIILTTIKQNSFTSNEKIDFILSENGIQNMNDVISALNSQYNKIIDHYNILIFLDNNLSENIKYVRTVYENLYNKILIAETKKVQLANINSTQTKFNEAVLKTDFTYDLICQLNLRIAKNKEIYTEEQVIPTLNTETYLEIANKDEVLRNLKAILAENNNQEREYHLNKNLDSIRYELINWIPIYKTKSNQHYTCVAVGSNIQFEEEKTAKNPMPIEDKDGTITIIIDEEPHYPLINNLANKIVTSGNDKSRDNQVLTVGGLRSVIGENFNQLGFDTKGSSYYPIYLNEGTPTVATNLVQGIYKTDGLIDGETTFWSVVYRDTTNNNIQAGLQAKKLFGAVYNDYAEYRSAEANPGRCIIENGDGTLSLSSGRLQLGANIVSDTYGFAIGETNEATCPVAVCGRVLAYPLESKEFYHPGAAVCSGPEGTVSLMTREEIREWPDAIIGYVSEVPTYDTWGTDNVPVNGRIWIKIK